jgi:hypothetical protein
LVGAASDTIFEEANHGLWFIGRGPKKGRAEGLRASSASYHHYSQSRGVPGHHPREPDFAERDFVVAGETEIALGADRVKQNG